MKPESSTNVPSELVVALDDVDKACSCQRKKHNAGNAGKYQLKQCISSFHGKRPQFSSMTKELLFCAMVKGGFYQHCPHADCTSYSLDASLDSTSVD